MIAFAHEHVVNGAALIGHPQAVAVDLFIGRGGMGGRLVHLPKTEHRGLTLSRTILI
jgi:hypothetical protein